MYSCFMQFMQTIPPFYVGFKSVKVTKPVEYKKPMYWGNKSLVSI